MNKPILLCFFVLAWILISPPAAAGTGEHDLSLICTDYSPGNALAPPAEEDLPDLRHSQGLLWQVESPEGHTSHLFGSLHSQDRRVTGGLPPQVRLALVRSRQMLIEVIPDAESSRVFLESMFGPEKESLADRLPEPLFREFMRIVADYRVPEDQAGHLKPWAAFSLIGRPRPVNAPTQDMIFYDEAEQRGIPVTGLETMQEMVEILESLPVSDQIEILTDTICNHDRIVAGNRILLDLYMARNLAGMVAFNEGERQDDAVFERLMEKILYQRNERMLERMRPHLQRGGAFIVVGALHLPAERGLLELLEVSGYTVSAVY